MVTDLPRVYLETPDKICFERRLNRDVTDRGRTPESVKRQYETTVRLAAIRWVPPTAANADLVLDGADELDWKVERVIAELRHSFCSPIPDP